MMKAIAPIGIAVLTVLALTEMSNASFAQGGSTGGTIGKQDKSLSGGGGGVAPIPKTRSGKPAPMSSSSPPIIHLNEHNATWGEFSATLKRTDSEQL